MKNMNQRKIGVILSYINLGVGCIIPIFYTPIMLGLLGQEEYGLYSLSNSIISYLGLLQFGMGSAVIRYITKAKATRSKLAAEKIAGLFTMIYLFFAALVIIVGTMLMSISDTFFAEGLSQSEINKLKVLIIIMTFSTACSFIMGVWGAIINSYEKFVFSKGFGIFQTILTPIFNLVVLYCGFKSIGMALAGLILQIISFVIYIFYVRKSLNFRPKFAKPPKGLLKELFFFSGVVFLSSIADLLFWSTDSVLIGAFMGSASVAVYHMGNVFVNMMKNLTSAISDVFVPKVTSMVALDESKEDISSLMIKIGRIQYLIISLILSGFIVFGQIFIHFWCGDDYQEAYLITLFTMVPLAIPIIQNVAFGVILAQNKHTFRSIIYLIIAVLNAIATYMVLPCFGIIGAAACTGISYVLGQGLMLNIYYYKVIKLNIPLFWKNILKMTMIPALLSICGYIVVNYLIPWLSIWSMLAEGIVYVLLFVVLSWLFTLNSYERFVFKNLIDKIGIIEKLNLKRSD